MANTLLTPSVIAKEALATLYANAVFPNLVHRDFDGEFTGKQGDTVTIRKPATFTANEFDRGTGVVLQDATETSTTAVLDKLLDVSFAVTAEELTLELEDFRSQFLAPAMEAILQKMDQLLVALIAPLAQTVGTNGVTITTSDTIADATKVLNDQKVPFTDRFCVLDPAAYNALIKTDRFNNADKSGSTEGLREAMLGRVFGCDTYVDQNITGGDGVVAHKTAFALVSRTLAPPMGIASNQYAVETYKGFGLRVVQNYDSTKKQDVVSIDVLCGVKTLDANRAVKVFG